MDGLNAGYAALLLEQYLENPSAVPAEWRSLFESSPEQIVAVQPGLARLVELLVEHEHESNGSNGHAVVADPPPAPVAAPTPPPTPEPEPDEALAPAIAGAMRLVNAYRSHGHLAA